jgi:hypothetical protein
VIATATVTGIREVAAEDGAVCPVSGQVMAAAGGGVVGGGEMRTVPTDGVMPVVASSEPELEPQAVAAAPTAASAIRAEAARAGRRSDRPER